MRRPTSILQWICNGDPPEDPTPILADFLEGRGSCHSVANARLQSYTAQNQFRGCLGISAPLWRADVHRALFEARHSLWR
jgi:hypothetical protein